MRGKAHPVACPACLCLQNYGVMGPKITEFLSDVEGSLVVFTYAFM